MLYGIKSIIITISFLLGVPIVLFLYSEKNSQNSTLTFCITLTVLFLLVAILFFKIIRVTKETIRIKYFNPFERELKINTHSISKVIITSNGVRGSSGSIKIVTLNNDEIVINNLLFKIELKKMAKQFEQMGINCELNIW